MTVVYTSRAAYNSLVASGKEKTQRCTVLGTVLTYHRGITRRSISRKTGMELGAVAGRVNGLIEDKLLREQGDIVCPVTKKTVKLVWPVTPQVQQQLF